MLLSQHFIKNWYERVGGRPTELMIRNIIQASVRVHKGMKLKQLDGTPFNTLSVYWHPDMKLVIQVDRFNDTAVSVLSQVNAPHYEPRALSPNYTPMTMHGI